MAPRTLIHPATGMPLNVGGRKLPAPEHRRLALSAYLRRKALPPAPKVFDFSAPAKACLAQVLCNDKLGDCTAAGVFHLLGLFLAVAGHPTTWTDAQVILFYSLTTGYNGTPATDNGGDEPTVLDYWREHGIDGKGTHSIAGHLSVNGEDPDEVRAAIFYFLNAYFGVSLPDAWLKNMPDGDGFVWDVAGDPNPDNGHCFVSPAAVTEDGVVIDSWGMRGLLTWKAVAKYATSPAQGEIHTVISHEAVAAGTLKAPNGLDWAAMSADFKSLGGIAA